MYSHTGTVNVLPGRPCKVVPTTAKGDNLILSTNLASMYSATTCGFNKFDNLVGAVMFKTSV